MVKRSKFSDAKVAMILRQADEGTTIGEVCRRAGVSEVSCPDLDPDVGSGCAGTSR